MLKRITFSVDCTYEIEIDVPDTATDSEIHEAAYNAIADVDEGDLENADWEISEIEDVEDETEEE